VAERPIGQLLDALGVRADIADEDLPTAAVVLLKLVGEDGTPLIAIADSEGLSWLDQHGIVSAAWEIVRQGFQTRDD
jgi:hypothetical protein